MWALFLTNITRRMHDWALRQVDTHEIHIIDLVKERRW